MSRAMNHDGPKHRGLRALTDRMGLAADGPTIVAQAVIILIAGGAFAMWFLSSASDVGDPGFVGFAALGLVVAVLSPIVKKVQASRQQAAMDREWQATTPPAESTHEATYDMRSVTSSSGPSGDSGLGEFWDAAIGDQLRTASERMGLGPRGAGVLGTFVAISAMSVPFMIVLLIIGVGVALWFALVFFAVLGIAFWLSIRDLRLKSHRR